MAVMPSIFLLAVDYTVTEASERSRTLISNDLLSMPYMENLFGPALSSNGCATSKQLTIASKSHRTKIQCIEILDCRLYKPVIQALGTRVAIS